VGEEWDDGRDWVGITLINPRGLMTEDGDRLEQIRESTMGEDVTGVTETWCKGEHHIEIERKMGGWDWHEQRRKKRHKNSTRADGGVGGLVREGWASKKVKCKSDNMIIIWMKGGKEWGDTFLFIVYLAPGKRWEISNEETMIELEFQIMMHEKKGTVVVIGDFNRRMGDLSSVIQEDGLTREYKRESDDKKVTKEGRDLMKRMNALSMILMNGVAGRAVEATCVSKNSSSVIDLMWVKEDDIGRVRKMEVWNQMDIGSDHFMVHMQLAKKKRKRRRGEEKKENRGEEKKGEEAEGERKRGGRAEGKARERDEERQAGEREANREKRRDKGRKWKSNDKGDQMFWKSLERECEREMLDWYDRWVKTGEISANENDVDVVWDSFRAASNRALTSGLGERKGGQHQGGEGKRHWYWGGKDDDIDSWKRKVRKLKKRIGRMEIGRRRKKRWRKIVILRRKMKQRKRKLKEEAIKSVRDRLDSMRKDPKGFWREVKGMMEGDREREGMPDSMVDEVGIEVWEEEKRLEVWKRAWELLGVEDLDDEKFDKPFALQITREMEEEDDDEGWEDDRRMALEGRGELNQRISLMDVEEACKRLRNGKAAGEDGTIGELFKKGGKRVMICLWKICEEVWRREVVPHDWMRGLVVPLYKGEGDRRNPSNYRGISLLSVAGKVFSAIINRRIMDWVESSGGLVDEQGGFRPKRGCPDQLFSITEIVKNRVGKRTLTCFIDIKKAFDRVFRDGIWKRMRERGMGGKIERVVRALYRSIESCVLVDGLKTDWFGVDVGVRQGCVLSPVLFSMYIDGLARELKDRGLGVKIDDGEVVSCLLYADDIVMFAESESQLQTMVDVALEYSRKWRFELSKKKTQVVVFGGSVRKAWRVRGERRTEFRLGGDKILKVVKWYKYLGMEVGKGMRWKRWKEKVIRKARGCMVQGWALGMQRGCMSVQDGIRVWSTLVRPVLEYGAEVWGGTRDWKWEAAEVLMRGMGRRILGCAKTAPNALVRGELGWWTMRGRRDLLRILFWGKLVRMGEDRTTRRVYRMSRRKMEESDERQRAGGDRRKRVDNWCVYTRKLMCRYGLEEAWDEEVAGEGEGDWRRIVKEAIGKKEEGGWNEEMRGKKKLADYRKHKQRLTRETYLDHCDDVRGRQILTRLRGGCAGLKQEIGRRTGGGRRCEMCWRETEDSSHFVARCPALAEERERWWRGRRKDGGGWDRDRILREEEEQANSIHGVGEPKEKEDQQRWWRATAKYVARAMRERRNKMQKQA
jgi:hypothetical protein